jgi:hypothetical protein
VGDEHITRKVAERFLRAMAWDRETFKDRVEEHVIGAYLEFYKATLGRKNGKTKWVDHWMTEVRGLLDRNLVGAIRHDIRGFKDKRKALAEVVARLKMKDEGFRRSAERVVIRDYGLKKIKVEIDDTDTAAFWKRVEDAVEIGFAGEEP